MTKFFAQKLNKKGFTLAELLVVIAIIAVLVAIAIPIFSSATTKAEKATIKANLRAVYAEAAVDYLEDSTLTASFSRTYDGVTYSATADAAGVITVSATTPATYSATFKNTTVTYNGNVFTGCD